MRIFSDFAKLITIVSKGVVRHVASALNDGGRIHNKKKIFTIGIAPWGLLKKRDNLVGRDVCTCRFRAEEKFSDIHMNFAGDSALSSTSVFS